MANLTNAMAIKFLNGLTGETPLTTPTTVYLALFTADPTVTGSVANELSGGGYARISLAGMFPTATTGEVSTDTLVESVIASSDWTEITHIGYMESAIVATDDMMEHSELSASVTVLNGGRFSIAIGDLTLTAV